MPARECPGPLKCSPIVLFDFVLIEVLCSPKRSLSCLWVCPTYICLQFSLEQSRQYTTFVLVQETVLLICTVVSLKGPLNYLHFFYEWAGFTKCFVAGIHSSNLSAFSLLWGSGNFCFYQGISEVFRSPKSNHGGSRKKLYQVWVLTHYSPVFLEDPTNRGEGRVVGDHKNCSFIFLFIYFFQGILS